MPVGFQLEAKMLAQVVEPRVAADEEASVLERLDVKIGVAQRRGIADDFLDDVRQRNDAFGPAEFIDHDGESLRMGEKARSRSIARIVSGTNEGAISVSV